MEKTLVIIQLVVLTILLLTQLVTILFFADELHIVQLIVYSIVTILTWVGIRMFYKEYKKL